MKNLFEKETFTQEDIQSFIDNEIEESIHLDFKSAGSLDKSDGKKKELSKDISAFANSDGGLIIYGIDEKDHKAFGLSFIDGDTFNKEWLEQLINTTIQRRIPDLTIYPVRFDSKIEQTVYVVKIPKSHETPHMARDKRFYKRFNFESVMMEEYEVRGLYGRRSKSKVKLRSQSIYFLSETHKNYNKDGLQLFFVASVQNIGDRPEHDYKVNLYFINSDNMAVIWNPLEEKYHITRFQGSKVKISTIKNPPIYQDEQIDVIKVVLDIPNNEVIDTLKNAKYEIKLLYGNGEDHIEGDFKYYIEEIQEKGLFK